MRGYEVLGLDISPDMIELANKRLGKAKFSVCDYETGPIPGGFNIAIIYDALHHAEDELRHTGFFGHSCFRWSFSFR